jgi:hypothetical protein
VIFDTDGQCYVARSRDDFKGWEVLGVNRFKPGVCTVWCRRVTVERAEFRTVYVSDAEVPAVVPT